MGMIFVNLYQATSRFSISFGTMHTSFGQKEFFNVPDEQTLRAQQPFRGAADILQLDRLMVLEQVHGVQGQALMTLDDFSFQRPYAQEGDYLITNVPHAGIGIATADCLPLILYDEKHHVVALIHAGWRGSVAGICQKVIDHLQQIVGTHVQDLQVIFGPSAGPCCYKVNESFIQNISREDQSEVFIARDGSLFFDLVKFNQLQLIRSDVSSAAFQMDYNTCTICSPEFCSYRRDGERAQRQMTIVSLNSI